MNDNEELPPAGTGTKEAMATLKATRPLHIEWGMYFAVKIALRKRTVHSREVWEAMLAEKIINGDGKAFWLGAVFKELKEKNILKKTGHMHTYSDESRGIHERTVALWELNDMADLTPYRTPPASKVST
jgi:hypothetical protein